MIEFVEARSEFVMVNEALPYITLVNAFHILYVRSMQVSILEMYMMKNIFLCVLEISKLVYWRCTSPFFVYGCEAKSGCEIGCCTNTLKKYFCTNIYLCVLFIIVLNQIIILKLTKNIHYYIFIK